MVQDTNVEIICNVTYDVNVIIMFTVLHVVIVPACIVRESVWQEPVAN